MIPAYLIFDESNIPSGIATLSQRGSQGTALIYRSCMRNNLINHDSISQLYSQDLMEKNSFEEDSF